MIIALMNTFLFFDKFIFVSSLIIVSEYGPLGDVNHKHIQRISLFLYSRTCVCIRTTNNLPFYRLFVFWFTFDSTILLVFVMRRTHFDTDDTTKYTNFDLNWFYDFPLISTQKFACYAILFDLHHANWCRKIEMFCLLCKYW